MMFWILTAALTAAVVAMLLRGLLRGEAGPGRASYDMAVYRDQLAELERERAQGLIGPAEAESAKAEIARRMLAVADAAKAEAPAPLSGFARSLSTILLMALPAAAIAIYLNLGNPGVPGQPFAERQLDAEPATRMAQAPGQAPGQPAPPAAGQQPGQPGGENGAGDLAGMAGRLAERLRAQPDDVPGWMLLGQTYMQLGRFPEGGSAYRQAYERAKTDPAVIGAYAEALVMTNSGTVSPEAEGLLREALKLRGDDPRARFYLALGQAQQGQLQPALDGLAALIKDSPADAPWLAVVQARAGEIAQQLGRNPAELPKPLPPRNPEAQIAQAPAMPAAPAAPQRGPTAADIQAAQDMTPEQRSQMVEGMVSGLAARLEQNPADVEGWLRLARAYGVMGKPAEQVKALARAAQQAPNRPDVQTAYADALLATLPAEGAPSADERAVLGSVLAALPPAAPQAAAIRSRLGQPAAAAPAAPAVPAPAQAPAATAAAPRGPTAADIQAAGQMAPADRQQMIQGMVAGLAARLEADPSDIEGWLRLARSYGVLGNQDGQVQALARAAQQAPDRPDVQAAYADALLARSSAGAPSEADRAALQALLARLPAGSPQAAAVKQRLGG